MKIVRVNKDGSMNDLEIKFKKNTILSQLSKKSLSKGNGDICELYKWCYDGNNILCYGWYDGDAGFENKHELIPNGSSSFLDENSSEKLLFGDLFLVCYNNKDKILDYCVTDYAEYYNIVFEGFDSCSENDLTDDDDDNDDDDDDDDDCDKSSLNNFIDDDEDDNDNSDSSFEYLSNEELDIDENEY